MPSFSPALLLLDEQHRPAPRPALCACRYWRESIAKTSISGLTGRLTRVDKYQFRVSLRLNDYAVLAGNRDPVAGVGLLPVDSHSS